MKQYLNNYTHENGTWVDMYISIFLNQLSLDQRKFLHILFVAVAYAGLVKEEKDIFE